MKARWVRRGLKFAVIGGVAGTVFGFVVMSLWNWLAPAVFGLRTITLWQALGILILSKILFGGFRGRPGYGGPRRRRMGESWPQMTPRGSEKVRQGMFSRCGFSSAAAGEMTGPGHV